MEVKGYIERVVTGEWNHADRVNFAMSVVGVLLFLTMCLVVGVQMVNRWILTEYGINLIWTESLSRFLIVIVTFYGAAIASRDNEHVKISFLMRLPPPRVARALSLFGYVLILLFLIVLVIGGVDSYAYNVGSQFHILPQRFPFTREWLSLVVILSAILMAIYVVRDIYILLTDSDSIDKIYLQH